MNLAMLRVLMQQKGFGAPAMGNPGQPANLPAGAPLPTTPAMPAMPLETPPPVSGFGMRIKKAMNSNQGAGY